MIYYCCPACQATYAVDSCHAGLSHLCRQCYHLVTIPQLGGQTNIILQPKTKSNALWGRPTAPKQRAAPTSAITAEQPYSESELDPVPRLGIPDLRRPPARVRTTIVMILLLVVLAFCAGIGMALFDVDEPQPGRFDPVPQRRFAGEHD